MTAAHTPLQVFVVGKGHLLYAGHPSGMEGWFTGDLKLPYQPNIHGIPSDWIMDVLTADTMPKTEDSYDVEDSTQARERKRAHARPRECSVGDRTAC